MKRMIGKMAALGALAGAAVLSARAAHADAPRTVRVGQTVNGALAQTDARAEDKSLYDDYTINLTAGQGVQVDMRSSAFDAYLNMGKGVGGSFESLANNDDGGGGTDARLRFVAKEAGTYTIRANALNESMSGAYTLAIAPYKPAPPPPTINLTYGQEATGKLDENGPRTDEGKLYALYGFTGQEGQRVAISTKSTEFDSLVQLGQMKDGVFEQLSEDDDTGGEKNARLMQRLPASGAYVVRAIGYDDNAKGAYTITVEQLPPPGDVPTPKRISKGQVVQGSLTMANAMIEDFKPYDLYKVRGAQGEKLTIFLRSEAFDAFLDVGGATPAGFAVVKSDDDGGGDKNSKLEVTFEKPGALLIRVSPLHPGATGAYSLSVE
jgi:hypothetical protein